MKHFALLFIIYIIIQMCKDTRDAHQNKLEYSTIRTHRWFNLKGWHGKISETGFFSLIAIVCVEKDDWTVIEDYSVKKEVVKLIGLNSIFVGSHSCLFAAKTDKPSTTLLRVAMHAQNSQNVLSFNQVENVHSAVKNSSYNNLFSYFLLKRTMETVRVFLCFHPLRRRKCDRLHRRNCSLLRELIEQES